MDKLNLGNWLSSRGIFEDLELEFATLQIVSLSDELINELKDFDTHQEMFDFVADVGLSNNRSRLYDDESLILDLPLIWELEQFKAEKETIVSDICKLSGIESILSEKLEEETQPQHFDGDNPDNDLSTTLGEINGDINAVNTAA